MKILIITLLTFSTFAINFFELKESNLTYFSRHQINSKEISTVVSIEEGQNILRIYRDKVQIAELKRALTAGFISVHRVSFSSTNKEYFVTKWNQGANGVFFNIIDLKDGKIIYEKISYADIHIVDSFDHINILVTEDKISKDTSKTLVKLLQTGQVTEAKSSR